MTRHVQPTQQPEAHGDEQSATPPHYIKMGRGGHPRRGWLTEHGEEKEIKREKSRL